MPGGVKSYKIQDWRSSFRRTPHMEAAELSGSVKMMFLMEDAIDNAAFWRGVFVPVLIL